MKDFVDFETEKDSEIKLEQVPKAKKALSAVRSILTNKYLLATLAFIVIMLFFDKNDVFTTIERKKQVTELEQSKSHYIQELTELKEIRKNLETDPATIEKLAREKYLMKRTNEDIFLTEDNSKKENKVE